VQTLGYNPVSQAATVRALRDAAADMSQTDDGFTAADLLDPEDLAYLRHLSILDQNRGR